MHIAYSDIFDLLLTLHSMVLTMAILHQPSLPWESPWGRRDSWGRRHPRRRSCQPEEVAPRTAPGIACREPPRNHPSLLYRLVNFFIIYRKVQGIPERKKSTKQYKEYNYGSIWQESCKIYEFQLIIGKLSNSRVNCLLFAAQFLMTNWQPWERLQNIGHSWEKKHYFLHYYFPLHRHYSFFPSSTPPPSSDTRYIGNW